MMKYVQGLVLVALAVMAGATAGQAQNWPQRPVKVLVPFAAGGNIDVMGRLAASRLSEAFGQQFVVENRVGGNGIIATEAVARSPRGRQHAAVGEYVSHRHLPGDLEGRL